MRTTSPLASPATDDPRSLPMQTRGQLPIGTIDVENRTVEIVFTTGAKVRRRRYLGWSESVPFDESLEVTRKAVNLDRLNAGAPMLDSHSSYSTYSQVAVIDRAWIIEGSEGRALVRFPSKGIDVAADRMFAMVSEGIIRNVSVGYSIDEVRVVKAVKEDDIEQRIVTRWTPFEISFVTIPADAGSQTRSADATSFPVIITRAQPETKEDSMEPTVTTTEPTATRTAPVATQAVAAPAPAAPAVDAAAVRTAERVRTAAITTLCARHGMPAEFVARHINDGSEIDAVRTLVLDEVAKRADALNITGRVQVVTDEGDVLRASVENALEHRAAPSVKLTDGAREFRGMSLMEMGRAFVEQSSGRKLRGLGKMEMASALLGLDTGLRGGGMLSTSDFPNILANVVSKRLRNAYEVAPQNWKKLGRQSNAPDFKARAVMQLSNLPNLKLIKEGGEYHHMALADSKEQYALATYGRKIAVTRQTLINDDMGAFERLPMMFGRAAAETEASLFWAVITSNPAMGDGNALFHASHGNLGTAGAISATTLDEARKAMRKQKGFAAKAADAEPLNLTPKYIVVSPEKETEAQQFLATVLYPSNPSGVNVFAGSLEQITEARLTGNAWYLSADPAVIDTIEYGWLEGEEGMFTEQRVGFDIDGLEIKGRIDFAAKAIDWRGMFKNGGN